MTFGPKYSNERIAEYFRSNEEKFAEYRRIDEAKREAQRLARNEKRRMATLAAAPPGIEIRECKNMPGYFAGSDGHLYAEKGRKIESEGRGAMYVATRYGQAPMHKMIADAFDIGGKGRLIRHINGDFRDNRPANLRWGTDAENGLDKIRHNLREWIGTGQIPPPPRSYTRRLTVLAGLNALHAARVRSEEQGRE